MRIVSELPNPHAVARFTTPRLSFGQAIAFHPLIGLLKRSFQVEEGDSESTIAGKIEAGALSLGDELIANMNGVSRGRQPTD